jgi:hypothetical protein
MSIFVKKYKVIMDNLSDLVIVAFIITTLFTLLFFYLATKNIKSLLFILTYMVITGALGISGFYRVTEVFPPRLIYILPVGITFVIIFILTKKGKKMMNNADSRWLILLHTIRLPLEIVLYYVSLAGLIPTLMTFDGCNFDIISGITAPVVYFLFFKKQKLTKSMVLIWNFICLGLLANVLIIAFLTAKTPFQQLALDQPNIAVTYFPFVWLPSVIVPIVLFSHIAQMRLLLKKQN